MHHTRSAILAFVIIVTTAVLGATRPTLAGETLQSPMRARFDLADGARVQGEITEWDQSGIIGTFGTRMWSEIQQDDVWRLYRALMDPKSAAQWINLGRILLILEDGEKNAERAFIAALRIDPDAQTLIDQARADALRIIEERRAQQKKVDQQKLNTGNPEAKQYSADRWPSISAAQRSGLIEKSKTDIAELFTRAGFEPMLIETDRFLFYSQMDREAALKWARLLDRTYETLAGALLADSRDPNSNNIFHGKAVVLCFDEYDRFQLTEAEMFNHLSPRAVHGLMHPVEADVYINMWRDPDDIAFSETLCQLATYAFQHRHAAPRRLPMWANEGLALYVTERALERSTVPQLHRARALKYIREGNDVRPLLTLQYAGAITNETPEPVVADVAYDLAADVGYLFIEMLLRENRAAFQQWVIAVKIGKDWPTALNEAYNAPAATIIDRFAQWYRVNN